MINKQNVRKNIVIFLFVVKNDEIQFDTSRYIYYAENDYKNGNTDKFVDISHIDNDKSVFFFHLLIKWEKKENHTNCFFFM